MANYGYQGAHYGGSSYSAGRPADDYDYYQHPQHSGVVAPEPQHARPQLPGQIQTGLARLDLNASQTAQSSSPTSAYSARPAADFASHSYAGSPAPPMPLNVPLRSQPPPQALPPSFQQQHSSQPPPQQTPQPQPQFQTAFPGLPTLPYRTTNIPESDDERGARLERDRVSILSSSNFEDQLGWAQDALNWVDAALEQNNRLILMGQGRAGEVPIESQLRTDAVNVTEHMASQHHPRATFMKGMWLEFGKFGYSEDKREAFECYSRAVRGGYARAEYRIGMQFEATGAPAQALQHYRAGEAAGDAASCYRMGMICALGQLGQPQDFNRAATLIRHAADNADDNAPQGAYVYGMLLANDLPQIRIPEHFLPRDINAGKRYIEKAAWLGFSKAQLKMASAYEVASLHCELNPALSMHYSALAARQGEPEAEMALSKWFIVGSEGIFPKNEQLAYMYASRASQNGLPIADFAMGYFNEVGAGTPVNIEQAKSWYQKAASQGNVEATEALQRLNNNHQLSMHDHENVTVNRIKSTHGSKRGNRPARLQQHVNTMPTVPDESAPPGGQYPQVPNYNRPPGTTPPPRADTAPGRPPRTASAVPYPLDDHRSATTAPYPGAPAAYPGADPRPSMPQLPPDDYYHNYPAAGGPPRGPNPSAQRPYAGTPSSVPYPDAGASAPYDVGPSMPSPTAYSAAPGAHPPPVRNHQPPSSRPSASPAPQGQPPRQPSGPYPQHPPGPQFNPNGPARPPKEPPMPMGQPLHGHPSGQYGGPPTQTVQRPGPSPAPGRMQSTPNLNPSYPPSRPSSSGPAPSPAPLRHSATAGPSAAAAAVAAAAPGPPPAPRPGSSAPPQRPPSSAQPPPQQQQRPASSATLQRPASAARPAAAPPHPAAAPIRPPGSGPKTFDQMGVPVAKNESECTVM